MMYATTTKPSAFSMAGLNDASVQALQPQKLIDADAELHSFLVTLYTQRRCLFEFDASTVKDYVPSAIPETHYSSALRTHDRQYGVRHFLSPSAKFTFPKYPSNENEEAGGMVPLPAKQSFECRMFGCDKDNAPPPTVRYRVPLNPWKFPLVDAPPGICPQKTLKSSSDVGIVQSSDHRPAPTKSFSRTAKSLPLRALRSEVSLLSSISAQSSSSDYSEALGNGKGNKRKRKAINPPSHHPQQKSPLAPSRVAKSAVLKCGIDACRQTCRTKQALTQHQRHLHSAPRQRISCSGCPVAFGRMEDLQAHLTYSTGCTTLEAARLLQAFYSQPEVIAIDLAVAPQNEVMGYWRRFLTAVQRKSTN
ncbi:hypothetical protein B0H12DRAFT_340883 [Mycena haematopus]|nr:hypothetical protein B0H12DRAFT_340883 [Mycena haematopus]